MAVTTSLETMPIVIEYEPRMITQPVSRSMCMSLCIRVCSGHIYVCIPTYTYSVQPRVDPRLARVRNIFLILTIRPLVCGSSRNLNAMILGTDPSRVPNFHRRLPSALETIARATGAGKNEGRRGPIRRRAPLSREHFSSIKPFRSQRNYEN